MKRRQSLRLLGLLPAWLAACKGKFPSTPTVVTGKVVDENDKPVEGIELILTGIKQKGLSPIPIFEDTAETDKDGKYTLSHIVTQSTDRVEFYLREDGYKYIPFINTGTQYELQAAPLTINKDEYGSTKTVNFQIRKP